MLDDPAHSPLAQSEPLSDSAYCCTTGNHIGYLLIAVTVVTRRQIEPIAAMPTQQLRYYRSGGISITKDIDDSLLH